MPIFQKKYQFDRYVLEEFLGSGSSAEVWKVSEIGSNVQWALKILAPGSGLDEYGQFVFREEFEKTLELHHPNILQAATMGEFQSQPYIIMPLSEKGSVMKQLRDRMMKQKQAGLNTFSNLFSENELAQMIFQISSAIAYLHSYGIIHKDVKPDNILIFGSDEHLDNYKLTDFGISTKIRKTIQKQSNQHLNTNSGMTPAYASPEVFKGDAHPASDIFSLAISIYELATGDIPAGSSGIGIGLAMLNGVKFPNLQGEYSVRFKQLIQKCCELSPSDRASAEDICKWSAHFLEKGFWPELISKQEPSTTPAQMQEPENQQFQNQTSGINSTTDFQLPVTPLPNQSISSLPFQKANPAQNGAHRSLNFAKWAMYAFLFLAGLWLIKFILIRNFSREADLQFAKGNITEARAKYLKAAWFSDDDKIKSKVEVCTQLLQNYKQVGLFAKGRAKVITQTQKTGYVNQAGILKVDTAFAGGREFIDGIAMVFNNDRQYGIVNTEGLLIVTCQYRSIQIKNGGQVVLEDQKGIVEIRKIN